MTTETLMTEPTDEAATGAESAEGQPPAEGQQGEQSTAEGQPPEGGEQGGEKAAGESDQEGEGKKSDDDKADGPPEEYDFQAPEGVELDDEVVGAFSETARELGLSQEAAQKVLDNVSPVMAQRTAARLEAARSEWAESTQTDKEIGGEKLQENLATAKKALETFGTPELQTLLNESGLGNHPEIIRAFYRAGKNISEDQFVNGQTRDAQGGDARSLYSQSNMNP